MSIQNISGVDLLVLSYILDKSENIQLKQVFWTEQYYTDPHQSILKLERLHIIEKKVDLVKYLKALKVEELKYILSLNNCKISGTKNSLIDRIINSKLDIDLSKIPKMYVLTETGESCFAISNIINMLHKKFSMVIDINDFYLYYLKNMHLDNKEIAYSYFKYKIDKIDFREKSPAEVFQSYFNLSELCVQFKDYDNQIYYMVVAIFKMLSTPYDFSNYFYDDSEYISYGYEHFKYQYNLDNGYLTSKILKSVRVDKSREVLFNRYVDECMEIYKNKFYIFNPQEVKNIIYYKLNEDVEAIENISQKIFYSKLLPKYSKTTNRNNKNKKSDKNIILKLLGL